MEKGVSCIVLALSLSLPRDAHDIISFADGYVCTFSGERGDREGLIGLRRSELMEFTSGEMHRTHSRGGKGMGEIDREIERCLRQIAQYVDVVGAKKTLFRSLTFKGKIA